jgi:hypothetical protein
MQAHVVQANRQQWKERCAELALPSHLPVTFISFPRQQHKSHRPSIKFNTSTLVANMHIPVPSILIASGLSPNCPAGQAPVPTSIPSNQTITWTQCSDNLTPRRECGSLKVPLDYTGVTPGILTIPVARIRPERDWNGKSVFFNPGGPGGREIVSALADEGGQNLLR